MKRIAIIAAVCALLAAFAAGQQPFGPDGSSYLGRPLSGLFSSDRISMRQSFTASYLSSGRSGVFTNLYRNTIGYRISDRLQVQLGLGYRFTPGNSAFASSSVRPEARVNRGMFLPSFSMRYQPTDGVLIQLQYETVDPYQFQSWGQ
jgi:hypothetical protein